MSNTSSINIVIDVKNEGAVSGLKRVSSELDDVGKKGKASSDLLSSSFSSLQVIFGSLSLVYFGKQLLSVMDQYTQLESRLALVTTGSANLAAVQQQLYDVSLRTHVSQSETVKLYTSIARATQDLGITQAQTTQMTETINQALIISGASAASSSAALVQLGQGLSSGVLRGEEFNSVMEQTPRLAKALADGLGVNIGQLREMAKQGQLTSDVITTALLSQKSTIESEFGQMKQTIDQSWTDLTTVIQTFAHEADKSTDGTGQMVSAIKDLSSTVESNKGAILGLFSGMITLTAGAIEGVSGLVRSVQGLAIVAASSDKTLGDWLSSSREDMKTWQTELGTGVAFIKDQLADLAVKRKDVAESFAFTYEAREAKKAELDAIDDQTKALKLQIEVIGNKGTALNVAKDSFMILADMEQESNRQFLVSQTNKKDSFEVNALWAIENAEKITKAESAYYTDKEKKETKSSEDSRKEGEKRVEAARKHTEDLIKLEGNLSDKINEATLDTYEYTISKIKAEVAEYRKAAGSKMELQQKITDYERVLKDKAFDDEEGRIRKIEDELVASGQKQINITLQNDEKQRQIKEEFESFFENSENNKLASEMKRLTQSYNAQLAAAGDDMDNQTRVKDWYVLQQNIIQDKHNESLQAMKKAWQSFGQDVMNNFTNVLATGLKGGFESVGDAWKSLTDSMLDAFINLIAKIIVEWASSEIMSMFSSSGSSFGSIIGGISGLLSTAKPAATEADYFSSQGSGIAAEGVKFLAGEGASSLAGGASTTGSLVSTVGGAIGVAGGAYGMYSGIDNISKGNYGVGTVQTGLGAYSAYQGAVTLDLIASGTATAAYDAAVAGVGSYLTSTGGAVVAAEVAPVVVAEVAPVVAAEAGAAAGAATGAAIAALNASVIGAIAGFALMIALEPQQPGVNSQLQSSGLSLSDLAQQGKIPADGWLHNTTDALGEMNESLKQFNTVSIDTSTGLMVLGAEMQETAYVGEQSVGNTTTAFGYMVEKFDASTGTWNKTKINIMDLADQMADLNPKTASAIDSTAAYVAQMAGVPSLADELAMAFSQTQFAARDATGELSETIRVFDESSGAWKSTGLSFNDLIFQMAGFAPATAEAIDATAAYVAEMNGVPSVAADLAVAFYETSMGSDMLASAVGVVGGAFIDAAREVVGSVSAIQMAVGSVGNMLDQFGNDINRENTPRDSGNDSGNAVNYSGFGTEFETAGHAGGGVVTRLLVPRGDDGIGSLRLGEGVIDLDTMKILSAKIRSGEFGGSSEVATEIRALRQELFYIAKNTQDTALALRKFDYDGMPAERTA